MITEPKKGFTMVELMVSIAIMVILFTLAYVTLEPARKKGRDAKRTGVVNQMQTALELYYEKHKDYPDISPTTPSESHCAPILETEGNTNFVIKALKDDKLLSSDFTLDLFSSGGLESVLFYCFYTNNYVYRSLDLWDSMYYSCGNNRNVRAVMGFKFEGGLSDSYVKSSGPLGALNLNLICLTR